MAHEVKINLQSKLVQHQDIEIEVKKDSGKLGTILISKGNIEWVPSGNHVNKHRLSWTDGRPRKASQNVTAFHKNAPPSGAFSGEMEHLSYAHFNSINNPNAH